MEKESGNGGGIERSESSAPETMRGIRRKLSKGSEKGSEQLFRDESINIKDR